MFPWTEHLNVAQRFPWVIPLQLQSSQQGGGMCELGKGNGKQMGLMVNFNEDSLLALAPLEKGGRKIPITSYLRLT